jgi:glycosyltransferase involved in cell wall biosynthesis
MSQPCTGRTLTVVAPVFNERDVICQFVRAVQEQLAALKPRYESTILLVVDRSSDGTEDVVAELCRSNPSVSAVFLSKRFGHQNSLVAGIDHCTSDFCLMMDSDLQHPPHLIPELLKLAEEGNDIVQTVRIDKVSGSLRRAVSSMFYSLINALTEVNITPAGADFRLISRKVVQVLRDDIQERSLFLRGIMGWLGFQTALLEFEVQKRAGGGSKYSWRRLVKFAVTGIVSFSNKPLKLAMYIGLLFSFLAFLLTLWILVSWIMHDKLPSGWTTLATMLSLFSGVQLLFLGVLGEYLGFIFEEVKRRPRYIVDKKLNI